MFIWLQTQPNGLTDVQDKLVAALEGMAQDKFK